jgi:hypothetical protein
MNIDDAVRRTTKGVIFDTPVLLAFIVGCWDISKPSTFKRTMAFGPGDLELMGAILAGCGGKLSITPAILAEACNLCDDLKCYLEAQRQGGLVINFNHVRSW